MKVSYFNLFRLYAPLGILAVILLIATTLFAHRRQIFPLSAEATTTTSTPDPNTRLQQAEQIVPAPVSSTQQPPRPSTHIHRLMRVTAYCACKDCCGARAAGITASGHKIAPGERLVAAAPKLPFGTMISVPGYNRRSPVMVLDRGRTIQDGHLDVFFSSHKAAVKWGVQYLTVTIQTPKPAFAKL